MSTRVHFDPPREPTEEEIRLQIVDLYERCTGPEWSEAARKLGMSQDELVRKIAVSEVKTKLERADPAQKEP